MIYNKNLRIAHYLIFATLFLSTISFAQNRDVPTLQMPYVQLNVNQNYLMGSGLDSNRPLAAFDAYLGEGPYTITTTSNGLDHYFTIIGNSIFLKQNLTEQDFINFSKSCAVLDSESHQLNCTLTITNDHSQAQLPIIIYRGLRAYSIDELISARAGSDNIIHQDQPYYLEISATPNDFTTKRSIVDLHHYFTSPSQQEAFTLDASNVSSTGSCAVKYITAINHSSCAQNLFSIENSQLTAEGLQTGIYQINVRASENTESAYQTFYLNVNASNPSLASWQKGAVASTNVIGSFPSIYVYSSQDPDKGGDWASDYRDYAKDLGKINQQYFQQKPIKTVFVEMISMMYANDAKTWPLVEKTNPLRAITSDGITNNRPTLDTWMNDLLQPFAEQHVGVTLNYTFSQALRASFLTLNEKQQNILAAKMVEPILRYPLDGLAMDLEGGFNQANAAVLYKKIADRLAYEGKWFNFYYFGDIFKPNMIAAFGPLGVANISTYDVGQYRAPQNSSSALPASKSYTETGFTTTQAAQMYYGFQQDASCSAVNNGGLYQPVSYCNLSVNDSVSENHRRFNDSYHQVSSHDAIIYFNGKYQLTLPIAASATEWNAVEIWNPDFTPAIFKTGRVMTKKEACQTIDHNFFLQYAQDLENPTSVAYHQLQSCLLNDVLVDGEAMQLFSHCGTVPYAQCILISSLPSSDMGQQGIKRATIPGYLHNNIAIYEDTRAYEVGNSFFAMENSNTAPAGAFSDAAAPNTAVQEPWTMGLNIADNKDPYYNPEMVNQLWQNIANEVQLTD